MTPMERMEAVEEIKKLKARYFRCMDTKDWDGHLAVFTPDAVIDSGSAYTTLDYKGDPLETDVGVTSPPNPDWIWNDPKEFVAANSTMLKGVSTVHHGHMPEIEITSPTTAKGTWAMEDKVCWPKNAKHDIDWPGGKAPRQMHGYGHYQETYEKIPDGWRIKTLKLTRVRVDITYDEAY